MRKINNGGWVAINCISTSAHTIWGALAGRLLLSDKTGREKLKWLLLAGVVLLLLGFGLDWTGITPIIKRIATSSFVLASGGWCLLFLAAAYWWVDLCGHRKYIQLFLLFGMNSIFIYLFFEIVGSRWFNGYISAISNGVLDWFNAGEMLKIIIAGACIFGLEWGLCWFLYKKKIFFRL